MTSISAISTLANSQAFLIPFNTPLELSSGVDGTLDVKKLDDFVSTNKTSVKVPPTSTPTLNIFIPP
jgi:hypothetical protein